MATRSKPSTWQDHPETSDEGRAAKAEAEKADAKVSGQVQENVDRETEQGIRGVQVDPTPNENKTDAGVTSGAPTPETDEDAAEAARKATADAVRLV